MTQPNQPQTPENPRAREQITRAGQKRSLDEAQIQQEINDVRPQKRPRGLQENANPQNMTQPHEERVDAQTSQQPEPGPSNTNQQQQHHVPQLSQQQQQALQPQAPQPSYPFPYVTPGPQQQRSNAQSLDPSRVADAQRDAEKRATKRRAQGTERDGWDNSR